MAEKLQSFDSRRPWGCRVGEGPGRVGGRGRLVEPIEALVIAGEMSVPLARSLAVLYCLPRGFSLADLARWLLQSLAAEGL